MWDWAFGTLYIPGVERETIRFGVGATEGEFGTVPRNYLLPFVRFGEHVGRGLRRLAPQLARACAARTADRGASSSDSDGRRRSRIRSLRSLWDAA